MGEYRTLSEAETEKLYEGFPDIDAEKYTEEANSLFTPYLFFHKGRENIELWSGCCMRHEHIDYIPQLITDVEMSILDGRHNGMSICPFCGKRVQLKDTRYLGKKAKLLEYNPIIILKAESGKLYARAYWSMKDYQKELNAPPRFMLSGCYIFEPGKAHQAYPNIYDKYQYCTLTGNYDPAHRIITEPFIEGSGCWWKYTTYTVLGLEEIGDSAFKYCQYEEFESGPQRRDCMKYLAACCIYPRAIEMLMKTGMEKLVWDLVAGRRKNSQIINWNAESFDEAFKGLGKNELRAWRSSGAPLEALRTYKQLQHRGLPESFDSLAGIYRDFYETDTVLRYCRKYAIRPSRLHGYLLKHSGKPMKEAPGWEAKKKLQTAWKLWKDYVDMCEKLHYDLSQETVLLPGDLRRKHDEAAEAQSLMEERLAAEHRAELQLAAAERLKSWQKKYNFELDDYFIRVAESAEEIVKEGKTLQHCVGGYAERHLKGQLTILFLRRRETPEASLYTIEMNGNRLQQIHGYKNERDGKPSPRQTMDWLLTPWLRWLEQGSKREKDGSPRLQKAKEGKTA